MLSLILVKILSIASTFLLIFIISHQISIDQTSIFLYGFTLTTILAPLTLFGTNTLSIKLIGRAYLSKNHKNINGAFTVTFLTVIITSLTIKIFFNTVPSHLFSSEIYQMTNLALTFNVFYSLTLLLSSYFQAVQAVKISLLTSSITTQLIAILLILFLHASSAESVFKILIISASINLIIMLFFWIFKYVSYIYPSFSEIKYLITYCPNIWLIASLAILTQWSGQIIANLWLDEESSALLNIAQRVSIFITIVFSTINATLGAKFSYYHHQSNFFDLKKLFIKKSLITLTLSFPILVIFTFYSQNILRLFGSQFSEASLALLILSVGQFSTVLVGFSGLVLVICGEEKIMRNIFIISTIITIFLVIILTPAYKINGAAIAIAVGLYYQNLSLAYFSYKKFFSSREYNSK